QYIQETLTQALKHRPSGDDPEKLQRFLDGVVPVDVVAMRLWDADGTLVYSSVTADETTVPGSLVTGVLADGTAVNDPDATTLRTYARAGEFVGEIDRDADQVRGSITLPWMVGEYGLIGVAIVLLGAALFAGRGTPTPKRRTDWGETHDVKQTTKEPDTSDPELQKVRAKAEKAEGSRRAMEDQLNMLRAQLLSGDVGSQSRIDELEGHLRDAHGRVTDAEERNSELTRRVAELETAAAAAGPAVQRAAALETETAAAKGRATELELQVTELEARVRQAETSTAAHNDQLDEANVKSRQAELQVSEAVDRAAAAERQLGEIQTRLTAAEGNGQDVDEQVRALREELAAASTGGEDRDRALREAQARAESAEQQLAASEARATYAESLVSNANGQGPQADPWTQNATPESGERVRELEIALADARAEAWATKPADERPSLGVMETHAVPEDEEAHPQAPQVVDEASAIRAELERMGEIVQHAGETGDVEGLRGRLTKSAARKKGRVGEDGLTPS
nr:hypothetical protein [Actinomycetota bacterium]